MKILLFFTWDVSLREWREKGLLQREMTLYQSLEKEGVEISMLTWGGKDDELIANDYPSFKIIPAYNHIPFHSNKIVRFFLSFLLPFYLGSFVTPDTIFKTNQMWGVWVPLLAKILYKKPLLLRTGFELYDFTLRGRYHFLRKLFVYLVSWMGYRFSNHIFVATESDKCFVQKRFCINENKITVCPNWIDTNLFSPLEKGDRKEKSILFVGRLNEQKNLHSLIESIKGTGYTLEIVGTGELEPLLRDFAERNRISVVFSGNIPNDRLPKKYNNSALFVLPSLYEGNPKALLEAMSCGTPVLGTNVSGIREIIHQGETGYLCGTSSSDLRDAIRYLMEHPEVTEEMGKKARTYVLSNNTLAAQVKREVKSLGDLIKEI